MENSLSLANTTIITPAATRAQLWGNSAVLVQNQAPPLMLKSQVSSSFEGLWSFLLVFSVLILFKYIRYSIAPIISSCFRFSLALKTEEQLSLAQGRVILFLLSLFHFSIIAFYAGCLYAPEHFFAQQWWPVPLFFLSFLMVFAIKSLILMALGNVIRKNAEMRFLIKSLPDFIILAALLTIPLSLLGKLFNVPALMLIWCGVALGGCYLLYLLRTLLYFIYVKFPVFFWILYLCSLEIAPYALLYRIIFAL